MNFYNDTMRGLTQAIEVAKGNIPLTERKGMAAPTYYVDENDRKGSNKGMTWEEYEQQHFTPEEIAEATRLAHKMYNRELRRQRKRRRERAEINKRLK